MAVRIRIELSEHDANQVLKLVRREVQYNRRPWFRDHWRGLYSQLEEEIEAFYEQLFSERRANG